MMEAGTVKPPAFDVVIVHSFSRFFRDHFELEFYIRKLAKNGVRLVSMTQELGGDPGILRGRPSGPYIYAQAFAFTNQAAIRVTFSQPTVQKKVSNAGPGGELETQPPGSAW